MLLAAMMMSTMFCSHEDGIATDILLDARRMNRREGRRDSSGDGRERPASPRWWRAKADEGAAEAWRFG
jgi:hypothetical protein